VTAPIVALSSRRTLPEWFVQSFGPVFANADSMLRFSKVVRPAGQLWERLAERAS
jgi:hypothetical protein